MTSCLLRLKRLRFCLTVLICIFLYPPVFGQRHDYWRNATPLPTPTDLGPTPQAPPVENGQIFPPFEIQQFEKPRQTPLFHFEHWRQGKVSLLVVGSVISPARLDEQYALDGLEKAYRKKGLQIAEICLDLDLKNLRDFQEEWQISWPLLWDGQGWESPLITQFQVRSIPTYFLIDSRGITRGMNLSISEVSKTVSSLLGAPPKPISGTPFQIEPEPIEPGKPFKVLYRPLRKTHQQAKALDILLTSASCEHQKTLPMRKTPAGAWFVSLNLPEHCVSGRIEVGVAQTITPENHSENQVKTDSIFFLKSGAAQLLPIKRYESEALP